MGHFYLALTYACHLRCINCPVETYSHQSRRLTIDDIRRLFASADFEPQRDYVVLSGGEPTLHTQLFDIIDFLTGSLSSEVYILSNSNRFSNVGYVSRLSAVSRGRVTVVSALYSHIPRVHDEITQRQGSFEKTVAGLRNLQQRDINISLKTVIQKKNYAHLVELARFVNTHFPPSVSFSFEGIDLVGIAAEQIQSTGVKVSEIAPFLELALDEMITTRQVSVHALPLCVIDPFYWRYFSSESKKQIKTYRAPETSILMNYASQSGTGLSNCQSCVFESVCPGVWYSYQSYYGNGELIPFIDNAD